MSNMQNISSVPTSGTAQDGSESTNQPEAPSGIMGLFEQLMTQALSSDPAQGKDTGNQTGEAQDTAQSVQMAKEHSNATQQNAAFRANLIKSLNAPGKTAFLSKIDATQTSNQTSSGTLSKTAGSKTEKNSPTQGETTTAGAMISPEIAINQVLAAAIPAMNPGFQPNAEALSARVRQSHIGSASKTAISGNISSQGKQSSMAAAKITGSDLSEDKDGLPVQAAPSSKAGMMETKNVELLAKNTEDSNAADPAEAASSNTDDALKSGKLTSQPFDSQPISHGTSIANQDMQMKQAEKATKIAGQTEKVLPGEAMSATRGSSTLAYSSNTGPSVTTMTDASSISGVSNTATSSAIDSAVLPTTVSRNGTIERTQEMVTLNAVRLSDSGNNSMQVVIKPDAGTQLSLELRQQGGNVQVQASLQEGDFNHLSQQWPELQQRLEQRGIQLAPLSDDGAAANANNGSGFETSQQKQNQVSDMVPGISLTEAPAGMFTPEAGQTSNHRGWETWA
jgi:hypothetical protein